MSLRTIEPRYQTTLISSSPRRYLTGEFVRSLPEEIRCCPKHSTMFVAVFVAIKRTESTRTFLYIQLSQQISIYRGTYAYATPCGWAPKKFCFHEPHVPLLNKDFEGKIPPYFLATETASCRFFSANRRRALLSPDWALRPSPTSSLRLSRPLSSPP
jgi:hypothetical protein